MPLHQIMFSFNLLQKVVANEFLLLCDYSSSLLLRHKYYHLNAQKGMNPLFLVLSKQPHGCTTLQMKRMDNNGLDYPIIFYKRQQSIIKRKWPTFLCNKMFTNNESFYCVTLLTKPLGTLQCRVSRRFSFREGQCYGTVETYMPLYLSGLLFCPIPLRCLHPSTFY